MSDPATTAAPGDILNLSVRDFLAATAGKTPTPGGGSVAALAGALAAALGEMALQYTVNKKGYEAHRPALAHAIARLQKARALLQELILEDIAAYAALNAFLKLPKAEREKNPDYLAAVAAAIGVPEAVGGIALSVLEICQSVRDKTNPLLLSDLLLAGVMAGATARGAELNVLANLNLVPAAEEAAAIEKRAAAMVAKAEAAEESLRKSAPRRG